MIATTKTLTLTELAHCGVGILDIVHEATALDPSNCHRMPILDDTDDMLDGFHRTAGMMLWARENDIDPTSHSVTVVVCLDDDLCQFICEHGMENADALDTIYEAV